jgi:hypothetical protein
MATSMVASISIGITSFLVGIAIISALAVSVPLPGLGRGVGRNHLLLRMEIELDFFLACADWTRCKSRRSVTASI